MKLLRLDLLRYGHLSDVTLNFPSDAALHIVLGANEAGKSTALAAVADALFGFGHRTDYDFLHGAPALRVGFSLCARDGAEGYFVRRKGRQNTLRDGADEVVAEDALRQFLGNASRDLFERGFGLDGVRLREGGQELLRSGGEAGESLLAGAGLHHLRTALTQLEEEARSLVGDGRGRRRLSEAVDAWRQAHREMEDRSIAARDWQAAEKELTDTLAELTRVQEQTRDLAAETSRLQRVRRVAPMLAELAATREALEALVGVPMLLPDAEARLRDATGARVEAQREAERETAETKRLAETMAALPRDTAVLAEQDIIDTLVERRTLVGQAAIDLPNVQAGIVEHRATIAAALSDLGVNLTPEAARDTIPSEGARQAVQRLIGRHAVLTTEFAAAQRALADVTRRRERAAAGLAVGLPPAEPTLLRRTIEAARSEGPLDAEINRADAALAAAEQAAGAALAALPLWHGDMASLASCPLPLPAEEAAAAARLDAAMRSLAEIRGESERLAQEIVVLEESVALLAHGETVPTPDAVTVARAARDRVWRLVRRQHDGGAPLVEAERADLPSGALPDVFESLRDEADRLADRRADDAQRVADYLTAIARRDQLREQQSSLVTLLATADAAAADTEASWQAVWAPAGLKPGIPAAMTEWRRARDDVLRLAEIVTTLRQQLTDRVARRDRASTELHALLPDLQTEATLAGLLRRADLACEAVEVELAAYHARAEALAREEAQLPDCLQAAEDTASALASWQVNWASAIANLGLAAETAVDVAQTALGAWTRIAEKAQPWRTDERRVVDMHDTIDTFATEVHVLAARLAVMGEAETDVPPAVLVTRLARRLADAREVEMEAASLAKRITDHQAAADDAAGRLRDAEAALAALRVSAGAADDAELARVITQAKQRDGLLDGISELQKKLLAQGDGLSEDALRADATSVELDAAVARLAEIEAEITYLGDRREVLSAARTRAEATLASMRNGLDAASKAQEAEDALATARATAERYAHLHVARELLRAGIDRFRREQQGPLLRAASTHFASLTRDHYSRLAVDEDGAGRMVLLAVRDDSTECPVGALSEGARDQLYLALRLAAIEAHAAKAEPLPFIADDLLVNFDDARAAVAIGLLAQVGRTTQTILFTHHEHVAAIGARYDGVAIQRIVIPK